MGRHRGAPTVRTAEFQENVLDAVFENFTGGLGIYLENFNFPEVQ